MFGIEFRPQNFGDIIGLDAIKSLLQASIEQGKFAQGYLFHGSFSSGKTTLARIFSRAILCENRKEDQSPCEVCNSCKSFIEGKHTGYNEIDSANNGGKDDIKEIKDSLTYESLSGHKIIVFDECHNISAAGNNALLKQLEEPNKNVILIFCTTAPDKMDSALRSRCWSFRMTQPTDKQVLTKLQAICKDRSITYEDSALKIIVRKAGQHFRSAENLLDLTSLIGDINLSNVSKSVSFFDDIIVELLLKLSEDLEGSFKVLEFLMSSMDTKDIYDSIVMVLSDGIKAMHGIKTNIPEYDSLIGDLHKRYGDDLSLVLDYIIGKERLKDNVFAQSDIILIHYKFLKKHFKAPEVSSLENDEYQVVIPSSKGKVKDPDDLSIDQINKMESWERADYIRKFKKKKLDEVKTTDGLSGISNSWGAENAYTDIEADTLKTDISGAAFKRSLEELLQGEDI